MKMLKGKKTVIFGLLTAALAIFSNADMQVFFAEHMELVGGAVGTVIVILRALTDSPMFRKDAE